MPGLWPVLRKELADHLSNRRFLILFSLILLTGLSATYVAAQTIQTEISAAGAEARFAFLFLFTGSGEALPSFIGFLGFLGPLLGLALGFDSINSEQQRGTLPRVLSQPIYRDAVINGKFLAGLLTIAGMLVAVTALVAGMGLSVMGIGPTSEEIGRMAIFILLTVFFVGFWLALAILFSLLFRQPATSALAGVSVWIVLTFFIGILSNVAADSLVPLGEEPETAQVLAHERVRQGLARISPTTLYQEATLVVLQPSTPALGPVLIQQIEGRLPAPLSLTQSVLVAWSQFTAMIALTVIVFAVAYVRFMRLEIR